MSYASPPLKLLPTYGASINCSETIELSGSISFACIILCRRQIKCDMEYSRLTDIYENKMLSIRIQFASDHKLASEKHLSDPKMPSFLSSALTDY